MKSCPNCDTKCPQNSRFCHMCGHALLGNLVIVYAVKGSGSKYILKGNRQKNMKTFLEYNDEVFETPGAIIIKCFEQDLQNGEPFIPNQIFLASAHSPVEIKSFEIEFIK